ncbi:MAG: FAD-dependent oxidoreductase [Synergistaceae bacterium]|nr:FAD-dependent oxidoreductase [Synergistaceae bacterium]
MNEKFDAVIVGSGPAGLFAARELARENKKVLLLDKGRDITRRICPLKKGAKECAHCQPCNVVCGWGGAGAFSDGKLTLTPDFGGNLEQYCGRKELISLISEVDAVYLEHGASTDVFRPEGEMASRIIDSARRAGLEVIPATIRHMGTDRSRDILGSLYLKAKDQLDIRMGVMVSEVSIGSDGRTRGVILEDGTEIEASAVLLAPGREGAPWMEETIRRLRLPIASLPVDIGVRVEVPAAWAKDITDQFYEIKAVLDTPTFDDRVRTFCMCPNGEVTTEFQSRQSILTVNGHSNSEEFSKTENTNFAILVSTNFSKPFNNPTGYGSHIARLANMLTGGIMVQRLGDLKKGRRSTPERIARGLVRPTLESAVPGDLSFVLPYRHLTGIVEMIEALDNIIPGINGPNTLLYGVEVKFFSLKLDLDQNLATKTPGLWAAGDGAGVTRGVVQASASGILAARAMARAI